MLQKIVCLLGIVFVLMANPAGLHADEPFTIVQGEALNLPKQPQAFASADGNVHLTFGVGSRIFYCNNTQGSFGPPVDIAEVPNLSLGMRRGPRIAASDNSIVVTAIGGPKGKGRDGDLHAYRSEDQGNTWTGPIQINDVVASAREGLHAMTVSDKGIYWCVWLDLRSGNTELYASCSTDGGRTWKENQLVYRSPDGSVCECCHPSIVTSGDAIFVFFRNSLAGNRDMYLIASEDNGKTFGRAQRQGNQTWKLDACPMDGGMIAANKNQKLTAVWRRDRSIQSCESKDKSESLVGTGEQPWVASSDTGFCMVWTTKRDGDLMLQRHDKADGERISSNASFPIIVSGPGPKQPTYLFWEERVNQVVSIMGQKIQ